MSKTPRVGLSLMPTEDFRAASLPLFEAGEVSVLEWSLDMPWVLGDDAMPEWVEALCDVYAEAGCLYGHGVGFSALSTPWEPRQEAWLARLGQELRRRSYAHVSEHFGFLSSSRYLPTAPFPVPKTAESVRVGREALARLAGVVGGPVGLENLAPVFGRRDAEEGGEFLEELLAPTDGFVLLDLHNLHCQSRNTGIPVLELFDRHPLERVRELHVAGGSHWTPAAEPGRKIACDTHDKPVPEEVFALLPHALSRCPNLEVVFFERFYGTLGDPEDDARFREDFLRICSVVEKGAPS
ncbi:MAG TPA: DUF692 family protein [Polyangiaceae bacterium]|jgi:uncharacterized protein (UPF0276 family)